MYCRHHQLHAGVLVLQCDLPLLSYDHSNFNKFDCNENGIQKTTLNALPTQTIMICGPRVAQQLAKVFY